MSSADKPSDDEVCASCGIKEGGDNNIKLKTCTACKLVKYCSVECQRKHRSRHKKACKKRAAELRDELLFKQPECTHLGDCPICFVPIPYEKDEDGSLSSVTYSLCCSKSICDGCLRESRMQGLDEKCPFCRTPFPETDAEAKKMLGKQLERGNPNALSCRALEYKEEGNYSEAIKHFLRAVKGGNIDSHHQLGRMYLDGMGVEEDHEKAIFHYEEAAIGGHPDARFNLGVIELNLGNNERAVKHWIIATRLGSKDVLEELKEGYKNGSVSKETFQEGLRGYQEAVNAMKTPQREEQRKIQIRSRNEAQK